MEGGLAVERLRIIDGGGHALRLQLGGHFRAIGPAQADRVLPQVEVQPRNDRHVDDVGEGRIVAAADAVAGVDLVRKIFSFSISTAAWIVSRRPVMADAQVVVFVLERSGRGCAASAARRRGPGHR